MKIWHLRRVKRVETTKDWQEWREASEKRRIASRRAAQKRREDTLDHAREWTPRVPQIPKRELMEMALKDYNNEQNYRRRPTVTIKQADQSFMHRISVNFLRHQATSYENQLADLKGRIGTKSAYEIVKTAVLEEIGEQYPWLRDECTRQIRRTAEQSSYEELADL